MGYIAGLMSSLIATMSTGSLWLGLRWLTTVQPPSPHLLCLVEMPHSCESSQACSSRRVACTRDGGRSARDTLRRGGTASSRRAWRSPDSLQAIAAIEEPHASEQVPSLLETPRVTSVSPVIWNARATQRSGRSTGLQQMCRRSRVLSREQCSCCLFGVVRTRFEIALDPRVLCKHLLYFFRFPVQRRLVLEAREVMRDVVLPVLPQQLGLHLTGPSADVPHRVADGLWQRLRSSDIILQDFTPAFDVSE